jgi:hypothetical protein
MEKIEFVKGMSYLGIALGKEYTQEECEVFYDFLKKYNYSVFVKAIKKRILKSSFPPKINELVAECESCKDEEKYDVVEFMKKQGYFKDPREYDKTLIFLKRGIVPEWLKQDINKYSVMMKQEIKQIGGY